VSSVTHETRPVLVWADCDLGIADMVEHLQTIPGVRTTSSCQGTLGEGGPHPYPPQVMATWNDEAWLPLLREFDITVLGNNWGYIHPRPKEEETPSPDGLVLYCGACRTKVKPEEYQGSCPVCGNGTLQEVIIEKLLAGEGQK
jgi:hypothetical protein